MIDEFKKTSLHKEYTPLCERPINYSQSRQQKGVGKVVQGNRVPFLRTGEEIPFEAPQRGMFIRVRKCHKGAPINHVKKL